MLNEGDAREMEIIKSAINNLENVDDFAKSTSGPLAIQDQSEPCSHSNGTYR